MSNDENSKKKKNFFQLWYKNKKRKEKIYYLNHSKVYSSVAKKISEETVLVKCKDPV